MPKVSRIVENTTRMWPREIFDHVAGAGESPNKPLAKSLEFLDNPGVYVLYRDDIPYYIGQVGKLRGRLSAHATRPGLRLYNFWNFFSAFVVMDTDDRNEIEGILIAAMPTANSARPRLPRERFPKEVVAMVRKIRREQANPGAMRDAMADTATLYPHRPNEDGSHNSMSLASVATVPCSMAEAELAEEYRANVCNSAFLAERGCLSRTESMRRPAPMSQRNLRTDQGQRTA